MAQHYPITVFKQKQMRQIEKSIREQRYFKTSMKFESLPADYNETPDDQVFVTYRTVPKSIAWFKPAFEVHTKPGERHGREVTNIYLVA